MSHFLTISDKQHAHIYESDLHFIVRISRKYEIMSSESDGEYSEIEEEPRLKYKRIGNNILGLVRSKGSPGF